MLASGTMTASEVARKRLPTTAALMVRGDP
jgi:hypothetical protein